MDDEDVKREVCEGVRGKDGKEASDDETKVRQLFEEFHE